MNRTVFKSVPMTYNDVSVKEAESFDAASEKKVNRTLVARVSMRCDALLFHEVEMFHAKSKKRRTQL